MIIDIHTHLGDILYPEGGGLIHQKNVKKKIFFDIISQSEILCHRGMAPLVYEWVIEKFFSLATRAERARNLTATLENLRGAMDQVGATKCACMPIPPNVTFADLEDAAAVDEGIIPFTGADYGQYADPDTVFQKDVTAGAKGLKLHPIIQKTALNSKNTFQVVEAFSVHNLPILFHCGISSYYLGAEKREKEVSAFGAIGDALDLVKAFPRVKFIAGHAGLLQYREVMDLLADCKNVSVDTSFQTPAHVRALIAAFGPERVLYASDWPFGNMAPAVKIVKKACRKDKSLENLLFHENAASLMNLE